MKKNLPHFDYEKPLWKKGFCIIGIDEVGRGSLAGPLVVGAVCFDKLPQRIIKQIETVGIDDSKRLNPAIRRKLAGFIKKHVLAYAISSCPPSYIDAFGMTKATQKAAREAVREICKKLSNKKFFVLVDAFPVKHLRGIGLYNQKAFFKADRISISIAAASIIAKVERDRMMRSLGKKFPNYHWGRNKGYATKKHMESIRKNGTSKLHRMLFLRKFFRQFLKTEESAGDLYKTAG